jgi:hypothetical protein
MIQMAIKRKEIKPCTEEELVDQLILGNLTKEQFNNKILAGKLRVGMEVIARNPEDEDKKGIIREIEGNGSQYVLIDFDEVCGGHNGSGNCKIGCGWWIEPRYISQIITKTT